MLLKVGRLLSVEIESVEDAVAAYKDLRDNGNCGCGYGASELDEGKIYLHAGGKVCAKPFMKISYNGKTWDM